MGRAPDYNLSALNRETDERGRIGAGWLNDDGSISIKFNAFVVVPNDPQVIFRLFPRDMDDRRASMDTPDEPEAQDERF